MRVVYVDLHSNTFFMKNLRFIITKQRAIDKHSFLLEKLIENGVEVCDFVTMDGSSLPSDFLKRITRFRFLRNAEAKFVLKKSKFPEDKITILTDYEKLRDEDIIIFYGHFPLVQFGFDPTAKGIRIGDQIHFYGDKKTSRLMKKQNIQYFMGEIDLGKYCGLYRENYSWFSGEFIIRKFSYQERFKNKNEFSERKNKAVAMGTLTHCDEPDFVDYYKTNVYQPLRKMVFDNTEFLKEEVDSFISDYQEIPRKVVKKGEFPLIKLYKMGYNYFSNGKQTKYFSFDMVEKYNEYKMFVCPEDVVGQYGIGVIEGMACGCAFIGLNYGVYEDLGFVDGVHYISYDGTPEDLKRKIRYYQAPENQEALSSIAKAGCDYVRENFSQERVAKEYYESLLDLTKDKVNL